MASLEGIRQ